MQDRKKMDGYLENKQWSLADEWIDNELRFLHTRVVRGRILDIVFFTLLTLALAILDWGTCFPSAKDISIANFPFAVFCADLFKSLCDLLPGGKPVAVIGLLLLPFIVAIILTPFTLIYRGKGYAKRIKTKGKATSIDVERKIKQLDKYVSECNTGPVTISLICLIVAVLAAMIMVIASAPEGENWMRYVLIGVVISATYIGSFLGCMWLYSLYAERRQPDTYWTTHWHDRIKMARGEYIVSYDDDEPSFPGESIYSPNYESEEDKIKRIADEMVDAMTGKGFGKGL